MGIFDRRKDPRTSTEPEPPAPEQAELEVSAPTPAEPEPLVEPEPLAVADEPAADEPAPPAAAPVPDPEPDPGPDLGPDLGPTGERASARHIHTVAAGESLADLASCYGVAAEEIARQNHLGPSDTIHAGQVFVITARDA